MMLVSVDSPPTSEKPNSMFSILTMKLNDASGSFLLPDVAMNPPYDSASMVFCEIRKMTNSAGLTGATPIKQMSLPLSQSSCVMVVRSHLTKNASSCVVPISAPLRQTVRRKLVIDVRIALHVGSEFGSNTAHCVPRSIDCSMKMNRRRTLMYFHIASDVIVRAPQTRMSRPSGRKRSEERRV